jgi:hypothetical protein
LGSRKTPVIFLQNLKMRLREIRHHLGKLNWLRLSGRSASLPERHEVFECGSHDAAGDHKQRKVPERRLEVRHAANGRGASSSARKTEPPARPRSAARIVSPANIIRGILDGTVGAAITNILVVGRNGSKPLKRVEIHFDDAKRVPGTLSSLATALESSGADFNTLQDSSIPATEIWLTYPLDDQIDDRKKIVLSCATLAREEQVTGFAFQPGAPHHWIDRESRFHPQPLIWESGLLPDRDQENRERTS